MANVPLGYKFRPTKEELLYYLFCFVSGKPLPCDGVIPVTDLYGKKEPWEICGRDGETEYFFTQLKKIGGKGSRFSRTVGTGKGTWSCKSTTEEILNRRNQIIGFCKDLRYQNKESDEDCLWLMREYSLSHTLKKHAKDEYKDYVLCRIKRKGPKKSDFSDKQKIPGTGAPSTCGTDTVSASILDGGDGIWNDDFIISLQDFDSNNFPSEILSF